MSVKGTIKANYELTNVTLLIEATQGANKYKRSFNPSGTSYNTAKQDAYMKFSALPVGSYRYIVAATAGGKQFILRKTSFKVVARSSLSGSTSGAGAGVAGSGSGSSSWLLTTHATGKITKTYRDQVLVTKFETGSPVALGWVSKQAGMMYTTITWQKVGKVLKYWVTMRLELQKSAIMEAQISLYRSKTNVTPSATFKRLIKPGAAIDTFTFTYYGSSATAWTPSFSIVLTTIGAISSQRITWPPLVKPNPLKKWKMASASQMYPRLSA